MRFDTSTDLTPDSTPAPASTRKRLEGTPQQEAFWQELLQGSSHVILEARAGTGKSASCREGMWRLLEQDPKARIRYCCFNKKIADEFALKTPLGVDVGTMHRFGLQALQTAFNPQIDKGKSYMILDSLGSKDLKAYYRKSIVKLVGLAKNHGQYAEAPGIHIALDDFIDRFDVEVYGQRRMIVNRTIDVLKRSHDITSIVDFDDMLWLPVLHDLSYPSIDFLFIDEAQDLNPVQHLMALKLCQSGRTIVIGDPHQAIYAFRGADSQSMSSMQERLGIMNGVKVMPLTVTFRCPKSHVRLAQQIVPDLEAAPGNEEGILSSGFYDVLDDCQPGDMVLCRTNAPLISECMNQIAQHRPATIRGRGIGDSLLSICRKLPATETISRFICELSAWRSKELMRLEGKEGCEDLLEQTEDKFMCLDAIASGCSSTTEIPGIIDFLFRDDDAANRITFSSVHRAKGSEARDVKYIQIPYNEKRDRQRPPQAWECQQRRNLQYVAYTRSLHSLTLITNEEKSSEV